VSSGRPLASSEFVLSHLTHQVHCYFLCLSLRISPGADFAAAVQAWTEPKGLEACGLSTTNCTTEKGGDCLHYPSSLFNRMVYPFVGYGLRSILWYQV
jgi:hypothetical protein